MNERIKKLAEQAEILITEVGAFHNTPQGAYQLKEQHMKKFAELIVRECMNTIDPKTGTKWIKDQTQEEFWKNQSVHLIKKHFGVEE